MPCLRPDGSLSRVGTLILTAAQEAATAEEIAEASGLPLFRARSAVRGLEKEGLLEKHGESYLATARGREKLARQA